MKYILIIFFILPINLESHPHVFIVPSCKIIINEKKQIRINIDWTFDEMTTIQVLQVFDRNKNDKLDKRELHVIKTRVFPSLSQFHYYTYLKIDGKHKPIKPKNFNAFINKNKILHYQFSLFIKGKIKKEIILWFQDKTIYVAFDTKKENIKVSSLKGKKYLISRVIKNNIDTIIIKK